MNFLWGESKPTHGELMLIELLAGQGKQIEGLIEEVKQLQILVSKLVKDEQEQELKVPEPVYTDDLETFLNGCMIDDSE